MSQRGLRRGLRNGIPISLALYAVIGLIVLLAVIA